MSDGTTEAARDLYAGEQVHHSEQEARRHLRTCPACYAVAHRDLANRITELLRREPMKGAQHD